MSPEALPVKMTCTDNLIHQELEPPPGVSAWPRDGRLNALEAGDFSSSAISLFLLPLMSRFKAVLLLRQGTWGNFFADDACACLVSFSSCWILGLMQ